MDPLSEGAAVAELCLVQARMILPYWLAGSVAASLASVYAMPALTRLAASLESPRHPQAALVAAAGLGAASPVCMYGTIPILASLGRAGLSQALLASFMVASVLINPSLFVFSFALGPSLAAVRLAACLIVGVLAGAAVARFWRGGPLFSFEGLAPRPGRARGGASIQTLLADLGRGARKTLPYVLAGVVLTAFIDRIMPRELVAAAFTPNRGLGVVVAASLGVPAYLCGGGTIPLLRFWLDAGMSSGSALAFMIAGPATKLSNLGAVKAILGWRGFAAYLGFTFASAIAAGLLLDAFRFKP